LLRPIDPTELRRARVTSDGSLGSIRGDTQRTQVSREFPSPFPERGFANVESLALLADCLNHHVDVRMWLIGMYTMAYRCLSANSSRAKFLTASNTFLGGVPAGIENTTL